MYKLTRPDGFDFYSGTINYRENIGKIIRVKDFDPKKVGPCGKGLHASKKPLNCFVGAKIPCAAFKVKGIQPIAKDEKKTRYQALKILEEIKDLNVLFEFNYSEAINPINPFKMIPPKITNTQIELLKKWDSVRGSVRDLVWGSVRGSVWNSVRDSIWDSVGDSVGHSVWDSVRHSVRHSVRDSVRDSIRGSVRDLVWDSVWDSFYSYIGSLFPSIEKWKYINHEKGNYPFQSTIDLWKMGLAPSFDGTTWRLHGYEDARILWKGKI